MNCIKELRNEIKELKREKRRLIEKRIGDERKRWIRISEMIECYEIRDLDEVVRIMGKESVFNGIRRFSKSIKRRDDYYRRKKEMEGK